MKQFATKVSELAQNLVKILANELSNNEESTSFFEENCLPSTCYLRMNRYPPCPKYSQVFGLMPHTDSDFLTILYQDQVGGLQLVKDGKWIAVKPNPKALIVNIGDLFQVCRACSILSDHCFNCVSFHLKSTKTRLHGH